MTEEPWTPTVTASRSAPGWTASPDSTTRDTWIETPPGWAEVRSLEVDPGQPGHLYLSGLPDSTLTLRLPVTRPDVAVPVVELFLKS
ncbi:hypothetical protein [Streptosporangium sp. NPDC003464]